MTFTCELLLCLLVTLLTFKVLLFSCNLFPLGNPVINQEMQKGIIPPTLV